MMMFCPVQRQLDSAAACLDEAMNSITDPQTAMLILVAKMHIHRAMSEDRNCTEMFRKQIAKEITEGIR